jgi:hypothetical protein
VLPAATSRTKRLHAGSVPPRRGESSAMRKFPRLRAVRVPFGHRVAVIAAVAFMLRFEGNRSLCHGRHVFRPVPSCH